jgi:anti-anti-sigma factor
VLVVALAGRLDRETSPVFADYVQETLRARPMTTALILDLTALTSLSRTGLHEIRRAQAMVERRGISMAPVAEPGSVVAHALESVRPKSAVHLYETRRGAITAVERSLRSAA